MELNDQIFQICERFDLPTREDRQARFIDDIYSQMNVLNNAIFDTKEKSDRRKEEMKKKVLKKIPKLHMKMESFMSKIDNSKYVTIENADIP